MDKYTDNTDIIILLIIKRYNRPTYMSAISKTITLRVPSNITYRALKDTRLEELFPEFFIGVSRKIKTDIDNNELKFSTTIQGSQIEISETFKLRISGENNTDVEYTTETNFEENNAVLQSIIQTHISNILYSLLTLETGYINGFMEGKSHIL
ncbi:MAG: hypothetical protein WAL24_03000 [Nitrososphaeraceae archaeon]